MMTREQLIQKWLDHDLTKSEEQAFMQLDDYDQLTKLSGALKQINVPEFDVDQQLVSLQKAVTIEGKAFQKATLNWKKVLLPIAAILIVCFGLFKFSNKQITTVQTIAAQKENIILPDASEVQLNTNSSLSFSENNWDTNRNISLEGEAFFKVAKGEKFVVETKMGTVTVLGTEFNIHHREGLFYVVCFEGSVQVAFEEITHILKPGETFSSETKNKSFDAKLIDGNPSWIHGKSAFKSQTYKVVIAEFERQYDVKIKTASVDTNQIFTGSFPHNDIEKALQSITLPLRIKATRIDSKTIKLSSE